MRSAIIGAGGIGAYFGGLLARDGHDVTFVARGAHLQALQTGGLTVYSQRGDFRLESVRAVGATAGLPVQELVVICTKTYDNAGAIDLARPLVGPETLLLTLQNGPDPIGPLAAAFGDRVLGGACYIEVFIEAPGVIRQPSSLADVAMADPRGLAPRLEGLVAAFAAAGIRARAESDARSLLWRKAVLISAYGAVAASSRQSMGALRASPEAWALLQDVLAEHEAVALADGAQVAGVAAGAAQVAASFPDGNKPSILRDLERGKPLEVDALQGYVVASARRLGVPAPKTEALWALLKLLDQQNRAAAR